MLTTLDLDDDLAVAVRKLADDSLKSFDEVVNQVIRRGLNPALVERVQVEVPVFDLGEFEPGLVERAWDALAADDAQRQHDRLSGFPEPKAMGTPLVPIEHAIEYLDSLEDQKLIRQMRGGD